LYHPTLANKLARIGSTSHPHCVCFILDDHETRSTSGPELTKCLPCSYFATAPTFGWRNHRDRVGRLRHAFGTGLRYGKASWITEQWRIKARIGHMAHHDALTGLPNSVLVHQRLADTLAHIARSGGNLAAIRDAVLHDHFELHYQPLFEMSGRRLIGFEALIRLSAEDGIAIPPLAFIPVAEDLRLIEKIGAWVLREACRTASTWPEHVTVAVNLSPAQFLAGSVSDIVAAALKETGLAAHRLELEITETLLLDNSETIMPELHTLKAIGVAIVMDDFGTGYSSLGYLWRFPFDKIKIDRSFMQGFDGSDRYAEAVVKTIIALGRELHMRVTVEGVETAEQAAFLDKFDGAQAQGFFFGRPALASEVAATILSDFQQQRARTLDAEPNLRLVK
jgi:EAL domain-containing protein (putative c-di-GMP-specific phosphodiesterase class I)